MSADKPFSVIVEAEIKEDRMEEFLKMIENNANKSRQEPGCIRFGECRSELLLPEVSFSILGSATHHNLFNTRTDVLRDQGQTNKFWFYEVYENVAAVDFHKTQAHYQCWADFKESGGTVSSVSHKADGVFIGGKAS